MPVRRTNSSLLPPDQLLSAREALVEVLRRKGLARQRPLLGVVTHPELHKIDVQVVRHLIHCCFERAPNLPPALRHRASETVSASSRV